MKTTLEPAMFVDLEDQSLFGSNAGESPHTLFYVLGPIITVERRKKTHTSRSDPTSRNPFYATASEKVEVYQIIVMGNVS